MLALFETDRHNSYRAPRHFNSITISDHKNPSRAIYLPAARISSSDALSHHQASINQLPPSRLFFQPHSPPFRFLHNIPRRIIPIISRHTLQQYQRCGFPHRNITIPTLQRRAKKNDSAHEPDNSREGKPNKVRFDILLCFPRGAVGSIGDIREAQPVSLSKRVRVMWEGKLTH